MTNASRRAGRVAAGVALAAATVSTWGLEAQAATPHSLTLRATGAVGSTVTGADQFLVAGDTKVRVALAAVDGGRLNVVAGPDQTLARAWQFPTYRAAGTYPRASVSLTPTSGEGLSPGASDFRYGAVFRLDSSSSGRAADNGDNIFQRGRYTEPSMFKLQVDHGFPSCLVKGSQGPVLVQSSVKVTPGAWYSATCSRVGSTLTVTVLRYGQDGSAVRDVGVGSSGTLSFSANRAASIGGKLVTSGTGVASSSDQLNGAVAEVSVNRL